jgi:predicted transcriptional regulator
MNDVPPCSRLTVSMPLETRNRLQAIATKMDVPESAIVKIALHRTFRGFELKQAPVAPRGHATPNTLPK